MFIYYIFCSYILHKNTFNSFVKYFVKMGFQLVVESESVAVCCSVASLVKMGCDGGGHQAHSSQASVPE